MSADRPLNDQGSSESVERELLHEIEHLDGQTFLRNVSPLKRQLVTRQIRKRMKAGDWVAVPAGR